MHLVVALLFAWFAYVQINDPDPILWVIIYGGVAVVAVLSFLERSTLLGALIGAVASFFGFLLLVPDFISWIGQGMPTITGSMKAESPHIELTREFLGFMLAFIAYGIYFWRQARKKAC